MWVIELQAGVVLEGRERLEYLHFLEYLQIRPWHICPLRGKDQGYWDGRMQGRRLMYQRELMK